MKQSQSQSGGINFVGALTLLFIALKLTGHITWSWFWVLSPIIFCLAVVVICLVIIAILDR